MIPLRGVGTTATLRGVGAKVFWAYPTTVVDDTSSLVALYLPAGSGGKNVERRPTSADLMSPETIRVVDHKWNRTDVLVLIVVGDAFSTYLMWETGTRN